MYIVVEYRYVKMYLGEYVNKSTSSVMNNVQQFIMYLTTITQMIKTVK